ncbi:MAG: hypothetical protein ACRD3M_01285, partial [Thermoanaerobaculia bacterium]
CEQLCYAPASELLERLLERHSGFSFSLALSGPLAEQLSALAPQRLDALRRLVGTGRVEPLSATSHHSLGWPLSPSELETQIRLGRERVARVLGREPAVFGGEQPTDAGELARLLESEGFSGMVLERFEGLSGPARRRIYRAPSPGGLPALLADEPLSEKISRRFSDRRSAESPLTAEEFDGWISAAPGDILCLSMDLAIFGLVHPRESGIFEFFGAWVARSLSRPDSRFLTPSEAFATVPAEALPRAAVSARASNEMQRDAVEALAALEKRVRASDDEPLSEDFRRLTGADHFARMALTRGDAAGAGNGDPFDSPYEAYMAFRHAVADLERRLPRPRPERSLSAGPPPA